MLPKALRTTIDEMLAAGIFQEGREAVRQSRLERVAGATCQNGVSECKPLRKDLSTSLCARHESNTDANEQVKFMQTLSEKLKCSASAGVGNISLQLC